MLNGGSAIGPQEQMRIIHINRCQVVVYIRILSTLIQWEIDLNDGLRVYLEARVVGNTIHPSQLRTLSHPSSCSTSSEEYAHSYYSL